MGNNQVKWGVILSYLTIILNTLYGLIITPYLISTLGDAEYGVYKTIASFAATLTIMDMGLGSTMMRYVAKYQASGQEDKIPNFAAMTLAQAAVMGGAIIVVSGGLYFTIRPTYAATFTEIQIQKAQLLFVLLIINMVIHLFQNVLNGIITGSNQFVFGKGLGVIRLLLRTVLLVALLQVFNNSSVIVLIDIGLSVAFITADAIYIKKKLNVRIKLTKFEKSVFLESGKYSLLMFLSAIETQINSNLDNVLIGSIRGPGFVAVYSMGLLIFGMFQNLSVGVSGVMLPTITNAVERGTKDELHRLIIRSGRLQFALMGAALVGFVCIGKDFLLLWLGEGFSDVYIITLLLICASVLELCVNTCISVLRAKNKMGFYITASTAGTIANAITTYFAVKYWSYLGAAVCTAVTFFIARVVVMGVYYVKRHGIPILSIYKGIFDRIWLCLLLAGAGLWLFSRFCSGSLWSFVAGIAVFAVIYGVSMLFYGLSKEEKKLIRIGGNKKWLM